MRLEPELWDALQEICERERLSLGEVVRRIEKRGHPGGRTSAVRVYVLEYYRTAAIDAGHRAAGHGSLPPTASTGGMNNGGLNEAQPAAAAASSGSD
jgi:predicted DNA-binding ribbon-helix-helix protein